MAARGKQCDDLQCATLGEPPRSGLAAGAGWQGLRGDAAAAAEHRGAGARRPPRPRRARPAPAGHAGGPGCGVDRHGDHRRCQPHGGRTQRRRQPAGDRFQRPERALVRHRDAARTRARQPAGSLERERRAAHADVAALRRQPPLARHPGVDQQPGQSLGGRHLADRSRPQGGDRTTGRLYRFRRRGLQRGRPPRAAAQPRPEGATVAGRAVEAVVGAGHHDRQPRARGLLPDAGRPRCGLCRPVAPRIQGNALVHTAGPAPAPVDPLPGRCRHLGLEPQPRWPLACARRPGRPRVPDGYPDPRTAHPADFAWTRDHLARLQRGRRLAGRREP